MLAVNENSAGTFHFRWSEISRSAKSKDLLKRPIAPFLDEGLEQFFGSHM